MKQFITFVRKEFYHILRDPTTLIMLFGLPIVMITLFGFALSDEIKNSRIVICDYAKDIASQRIIDKIEISKNFEIKKVILSHHEINDAFKSGKIKLAIVFPANFNKDLLHLNTASIQIIADASDPNVASALTFYITHIVMEYQSELMQASAAPYQIIPEIRMLYNPALKGATNFVPGIMAFVLLLVSVLMTSGSIVKEKERGTMEVLLVSPFNPFFVIVAKAVPYFLISLVNLILILLMSIFFLECQLTAVCFLLFALSSLFILCSLAVGLLISNTTDSQQASMLVSLMGMLIPAFLFTGFMFPLENMPWPLQAIANIIPSKWYYIIVKSIMIKGLGFSAIWKETLILLGMTVLLFGGTLKTFKIRLA